MKEAKERSSVIYISIDDTVIPKTRHSSKPKRPTAGARWNYSYSEGKNVYEHQIYAVLASSGGLSLVYEYFEICSAPWRANRYFKDLRLPFLRVEAEELITIRGLHDFPKGILIHIKFIVFAPENQFPFRVAYRRYFRMIQPGNQIRKLLPGKI